MKLRGLTRSSLKFKFTKILNFTSNHSKFENYTEVETQSGEPVSPPFDNWPLSDCQKGERLVHQTSGNTRTWDEVQHQVYMCKLKCIVKLHVRATKEHVYKFCG